MKPLTAALIAVQQNADLLKGEKGDPGRDGDPGVEGKAAVDGLVWRGTFAYGTTYQPGDVVEWEGSSYVALVVTARRPPDPDWDLLAAKGEAGASGRGYIRGGGGSGSGSALTVKDEGVSLTAAAASLDFAGAGVTATAVGTAVTVTIPAGGVSDHGALTGLADNDHPQYLTQAEGDAAYIPQGGPLTEDFAAGNFRIVGTDDGGGALGAYLTVGDASGDGGGNASLYGGIGAEGWTAAHFEARGGNDDSNAAGDAYVYAGDAAGGSDADGGDVYLVAGVGDGAGNPGRVEITTGGATGSSGDVLTAQGDGTALWVPPAASGLTQPQVMARAFFGC